MIVKPKIAEKLEFKKKTLNIPKEWIIYKNDFVDLEPNNSIEIDEVWHYFQEDIFQSNYGEYFIDLGFYGDYLNNRNGFFRLIIAKGDYGKGELYEKFLSRSTEEIKEKLEFYSILLLKENIKSLNGLKYGQKDEEEYYDIYSAINKIAKKLNDEDFKQISSS